MGIPFSRENVPYGEGIRRNDGSGFISLQKGCRNPIKEEECLCVDGVATVTISELI